MTCLLNITFRCGYEIIMGWSLGYDNDWERDIGYGVPALCDHPKCDEKIDRGLAHVCGGEPYGGENGCGLYFCGDHLSYRNVRDEGWVDNCPRCRAYKLPYKHPKPDAREWIMHKLSHSSWKKWRIDNPKEVQQLIEEL